MTSTQPSNAPLNGNNDIVSAVAAAVAEEAKWAKPGDPPSHMELLLAALEIDRRQDKLWGAHR